ncbi:hypothetical protein C8R44DRAFT_976981 [Mycena epipterygia]|nr:hypothetical protein C8R44DRAFT_976981 [Mycena epipterygia]
MERFLPSSMFTVVCAAPTSRFKIRRAYGEGLLMQLTSTIPSSIGRSGLGLSRRWPLRTEDPKNQHDNGEYEGYSKRRSTTTTKMDEWLVLRLRLTLTRISTSGPLPAADVSEPASIQSMKARLYARAVLLTQQYDRRVGLEAGPTTPSLWLPVTKDFMLTIIVPPMTEAVIGGYKMLLAAQFSPGTQA